MPRKAPIIPEERIQHAIHLIRGHKVILDFDLAAIDGVDVKRLNQQVRRNIERFPDDFAFLLTAQEFANLKLQIATSNSAWGGRRKPPLAFTEHGAVVRLRQLLASHAELARKLDALEAKFAEHDKQIVVVFKAIRELMAPPTAPPNERRIGFQAPSHEPRQINRRSKPLRPAFVK
jgi:hypothetical protein